MHLTYGDFRVIMDPGDYISATDGSFMFIFRWVTSGSTLAPEDPCFFCDTCFRALHYDNNGKKLVAGMKAYHYPDVRPFKK